jgi:NitT/TauT family transport system substrate-binding protein
MRTQHARPFSRRRFLEGLTLAGTAGLLGLHARPVAAEPPPETTTLRIFNGPAACLAPQLVAADLLRAEGFTDLQYVSPPPGPFSKPLAAGEIDLSMLDAPGNVLSLDRGEALVILAGVHVGCFELFSREKVRSVRELKGRTVAVTNLGSGRHLLLASMAVLVGLDPHQDLHFVEHPALEGMRLFAEGKIDAFMGFPPEPQELRAKQIGHVMVSTALDRPWSQYFCCMLVGNRAFVRAHPVATKRALRAILKATDVCALEPDRAARLLVDNGYTDSYVYARQTMQEVPYDKWREYNPEDTLRFYALRLQEARMITSSPQKLIAQGTDWRFLTELKKELKG